MVRSHTVKLLLVSPECYLCAEQVFDMHSKFGRVIFVSLATILMLVPASSLLAQSETPQDTDSQAVHFSLHAVGDFENDYFDDVEATPGETADLEVMVINWKDDPVDIRLYPANAHNAINGGFQAGEREEDLSGSALWLDISIADLTLEPGERRSVPFSVAVPEDTDPGQYISAIVAETADTMPIPGEDQINHSIRYAISVGVLVPGDVNASMELGNPTYSEISLDIPISNTGKVLVRPTGDVVLFDGNGDEVLTSPIELGSIYAGNSTLISFGLPTQLPDDEYHLSIQLADPESGYEVSLTDVPVEFVSVVAEPLGSISLVSIEVEPNDDDISYANIDLTILNEDQQIPVNILLGVYRDGELVEEAPLATNQVMVPGENTITVRYLPEDTWQSGTYTFDVTVIAVDPETNQETILLAEEIDTEILVP